MNDFRSAAHFDPSRYRLFPACIFVDIYKRAMHCSKKTVCLLRFSQPNTDRAAQARIGKGPATICRRLFAAVTPTGRIPSAENARRIRDINA
jgi:hypothetical protein